MQNDYSALIVFKARDTLTNKIHYHAWIRLDRKDMATALVELHCVDAEVISVINDYDKYKGNINEFIEQTRHTEEKNEKSLKDKIFEIRKEIYEATSEVKAE